MLFAFVNCKPLVYAVQNLKAIDQHNWKFITDIQHVKRQTRAVADYLSRAVVRNASAYCQYSYWWSFWPGGPESLKMLALHSFTMLPQDTIASKLLEMAQFFYVQGTQLLTMRKLWHYTEMRWAWEFWNEIYWGIVLLLWRVIFNLISQHNFIYIYYKKCFL